MRLALGSAFIMRQQSRPKTASDTNKLLKNRMFKLQLPRGRGCGTVGKAVASKPCGKNPVIGTIFSAKLSICPGKLRCRKDDNQQKEARNGPLIKL